MTSLLSDLARTASGFVAWLFAIRRVGPRRRRTLGGQWAAIAFSIVLINGGLPRNWRTPGELVLHGVAHQVTAVAGVLLFLAIVAYGLRLSWRDVRRARPNRYGLGYHAPPG